MSDSGLSIRQVLRMAKMQMMSSRLAWTGAALIGAAVVVSAQGRGGGAWTTVAGDAQRTSFVRTDPRIFLAALQAPG